MAAALIASPALAVEDINVMVDYENNFKVIMKDGKVYKNTLK